MKGLQSPADSEKVEEVIVEDIPVQSKTINEEVPLVEEQVEDNVEVISEEDIAFEKEYGVPRSVIEGRYEARIQREIAHLPAYKVMFGEGTKISPDGFIINSDGEQTLYRPSDLDFYSELRKLKGPEFNLGRWRADIKNEVKGEQKRSRAQKEKITALSQ